MQIHTVRESVANTVRTTTLALLKDSTEISSVEFAVSIQKHMHCSTAMTYHFIYMKNILIMTNLPRSEYPTRLS